MSRTSASKRTYTSGTRGSGLVVWMVGAGKRRRCLLATGHCRIYTHLLLSLLHRKLQGLNRYHDERIDTTTQRAHCSWAAIQSRLTAVVISRCLSSVSRPGRGTHTTHSEYLEWHWERNEYRRQSSIQPKIVVNALRLSLLRGPSLSQASRICLLLCAHLRDVSSNLPDGFAYAVHVLGDVVIHLVQQI